MRPSPLVSIVMPVFNDETWIAKAMDSCLTQTLEAVEVICVDDASTDATRRIIEDYQERDDRVQLIRHKKNLGAFQGRRTAIERARAPYVIFIDGDDELEPQAAELSVAQAQRAEADVVGFDVSVFGPQGDVVGGYQKRMRPPQEELEGGAIFHTLFPTNKPSQGQLWRFLFSTELLRAAYSAFDHELYLPRVNDLPLTFMVMASAQKYSYVPERLYRYYFGRGGSGQKITALSGFEFYARGIDSVQAIGPALKALSKKSLDDRALVEAYTSVHRSVIANVLSYMLDNATEDLYSSCLAHLHDKVSEADVVLAAAEYAPRALEIIARYGRRVELISEVQNVLLATDMLTADGVSSVVLAQARYLSQTGYTVTIATMNRGSVLDSLPKNVRFVEIMGNGLAERLEHWQKVCSTYAVDVVIDHQVHTSQTWHAYAIASRIAGIATIGWVHDFALSPVHDLTNMISSTEQRACSLASLVTPSQLDVTFWKLRGVAHSMFLPHPPSPMMIDAGSAGKEKAAPSRPLELIWWGQLKEDIAEAKQLLSVAQLLRRAGVRFRMRIIGQNPLDQYLEPLSGAVDEQRLGQHVEVLSPLHGQALLEALDSADVFVSTSITGGNQVALMEAQSRGLPIAMYELPWMTAGQDNQGTVTAQRGDIEGLAQQVRELAADPERYKKLSRASIAAANRTLEIDFSQLYQQLITGALPPSYSPEPTFEDAQRIIDWSVYYAERHNGIRAELEETKKSVLRARSAARKATAKAEAAERAHPRSDTAIKVDATPRKSVLGDTESPTTRGPSKVLTSLRPYARRVRKLLKL